MKRNRFKQHNSMEGRMEPINLREPITPSIVRQNAELKAEKIRLVQESRRLKNIARQWQTRAVVPDEPGFTPPEPIKRRPTKASAMESLRQNGKCLPVFETSVVRGEDGYYYEATTFLGNHHVATSPEALGWTLDEINDPTITY